MREGWIFPEFFSPSAVGPDRVQAQNFGAKVRSLKLRANSNLIIIRSSSGFHESESD
jgi:hypothetical protein